MGRLDGDGGRVLKVLRVHNRVHQVLKVHQILRVLKVHRVHPVLRVRKVARVAAAEVAFQSSL